MELQFQRPNSEHSSNAFGNASRDRVKLHFVNKSFVLAIYPTRTLVYGNLGVRVGGGGWDNRNENLNF